MIKRLIYIVLVLAVCPAVGMGAVDDGAEDVFTTLFGEGMDAAAADDYATAIDRLNRAIAADPYNPSLPLVLSNLGILYMYEGNDSLALASLDRAHAIAPKMVTVLSNRATVYLNRGDREAAYGDLSTVISLDSLNADARYLHGMLALYSGDHMTASQDFGVLESVLPDHPSTWLAMGTLCSFTGRDREAVPYLKKLVAEDPAPEYYAALAGCHLALAELSEAAEVISAGLEAYPRDAELYYYRAWLNRDSYLLRQAQSDARMAKELGADPRKVDALFE